MLEDVCTQFDTATEAEKKFDFAATSDSYPLIQYVSQVDKRLHAAQFVFTVDMVITYLACITLKTQIDS